MNAFTPELREKIQVFLGSLAPLAILLGFGSEGTWEQVLIIAGAVLIFVAAVLSLANLKVADWATQGWAIVRGAVYALAATVSPALVLLGLYNADTNAAVLTGLSLGLAALSSLIAIFANGKQQVAAVITTP